MKKLIYLYFINDRYSAIEEKISDYGYIGCFLDEFGTSKALRARVYEPKSEEESKKLDEMYDVAEKCLDEWSNEPVNFLSKIEDIYLRIYDNYFELKWLIKGLIERIFR